MGTPTLRDVRQFGQYHRDKWRSQPWLSHSIHLESCFRLAENGKKKGEVGQGRTLEITYFISL